LLPVGKSEAEQVFDRWRTTFRKNANVVFNEKRRKVVDGRLEGKFDGKPSRKFTLAELLLCVDGYRLSPHHAGANASGATYDDLALFMRDDEHVEAGLAFAERDPSWSKPLRANELEAGGSALVGQEETVQRHRQHQEAWLAEEALRSNPQGKARVSGIIAQIFKGATP
jgi:hypothetical protein